MIAVDAGLVADLEGEVGDALRAVATYDEDGYRFHHLRPDVREAYSEEEIQAVYEDLVIQGLSTEYVEQLFHAGRLRCSIYGFDEAAMFHFASSEYAGLFVSVDADVPLNLDSIISVAKDAVERAE